jgi:hypothetical protein
MKTQNLIPIILRRSRLFLAIVATWIVGSAIPLHAASPITPGTIEVYPTYHNIGTEIPYTGDDNRSSTVTWPSVRNLPHRFGA